jgi:protein-S-isoprenylcysteine O-methyltransferase Ste14
LLLLPLVALSLGHRAIDGAGRNLLWGVICLAVALVGLGIRIVAVATAPGGTSERSTRDPRATALRTSGLYSIVRHPLYVANTLIARGLALFSGTWYLPLIVLLFGLLYYERIGAREEQFLEAKFGDEFREWANRVPAVLPAVRRYQRSSLGFGWKKVLRREFHALFVIGAGFFVLDVSEQLLARSPFRLDPFWTWVFVVTAIVFLVMSGLKKFTRVLSDHGDTVPVSVRPRQAG